MKPAILVLAFGLATISVLPRPVAAEPSFGLGVSFVFGGGIVLGARVFSTDNPQSGAVSLGVDYNFTSRSIRPSIGVAYLDDNAYVDFSIGLDTTTNNLDFGIGAGGLMNMQDTPAPVGGGGGGAEGAK